ncbi:branched-chain amino acid ABC transporter permease [Ferrovibrio sp.]|uniref:branched-chain amino acid ABC transporter permease n=1 Tax=Ferrovibrio sp. TaxID=1917215 RepID=UPI0025C30DD0|nr:branched-chain amino acid ABC transporter permease [Ferrovibrio sp.]MBX3452933.1 branched-chain amino acid ABC transporter permease [Ferrovibrio sp.]
MRSGHAVEDYRQLVALSDNPITWFWVGLLILLLLALPGLVPTYTLVMASAVGIAAIGAIGLNLLTGTTGLISLGQAGFLAVGAYTCALLMADYGWPAEAAMPAAAIFTGLLSLVIGVPSLRLKGLYLAITTLAFSLIVTHFILYSENLTHGPFGVRIANPTMLGMDIASDVGFYYFVGILLLLVSLFALNVMRTRIGRAWIAIRDHDIAAQVMGINLVHYKLLAFFVSSSIVGLAGALTTLRLRFINVEVFDLLISIEALAMIIVGGLGSVAGSILGAAFIVLLPEGVRILLDFLTPEMKTAYSNYVYEVRGLLIGAIVIIILRVESGGLVGIWMKTKRYWINWPLPI